MENGQSEKEKMPSLQKQYLSMMGLAVVFVTVGIIFSIKAFRGMERPVGPGVSDEERERIVRVYSLIDAAGEMAVSDTAPAKVTLKQAFDELGKLEGYKMESGNIFRKKSSALLAAYATRAKIQDIEKDCVAVKQTVSEMNGVMNEKYVLIPFRPVGPFTVMFGDEEFYETSRKKNNDVMKLRMERELENCGVSESGI